MTTDQMRNILAEVYSGPKWRLKLMQMPERQVIAIYKDMERKGKLKKRKKPKEPDVKKAVQLNILDYIK